MKMAAEEGHGFGKYDTERNSLHRHALKSLVATAKRMYMGIPSRAEPCFSVLYSSSLATNYRERWVPTRHAFMEIIIFVLYCIDVVVLIVVMPHSLKIKRHVSKST